MANKAEVGAAAVALAATGAGLQRVSMYFGCTSDGATAEHGLATSSGQEINVRWLWFSCKHTSGGICPFAPPSWLGNAFICQKKQQQQLQQQQQQQQQQRQQLAIKGAATCSKSSISAVQHMLA
jgi:hypothetical protein